MSVPQGVSKVANVYDPGGCILFAKSNRNRLYKSSAVSLLIFHEHKVTGLGSGSKLSPAVQCIAMVFLNVLEDKTKVIQCE